MKKLSSIILLAGCAAGLTSVASAQYPKAVNGFAPEFGGEPLSGNCVLSLPGKARSLAPQLRLGERNPLKPPFVEVFDDYPAGSENEQFERYFQVINSDGDVNPLSGSDRSWGYYNFNGESGGRQFSKCAYLQYPLNVAKCDDWLILRAIKFEAGKYYHITLDASLFSEGTIHTMEVKMGEYNDAEGMTIPVIPVTDVVSIRPEQLEGWFVPEYDGNYYMGIHGLSDRILSNQGYLFVDNIAVEAARSGREPGQVTDVEFVSDPNGTPSATISFKAPSVGVDGKAISGSMTVTVKRDDAKVKTFTATPGKAIEFVDQVEKPGYYTYTFTVSNGDGSGSDLRMTRYVGMGAPEHPVITSISEPRNGYVHLSWDAPATDVNGTVINPEKLLYNVYKLTEAGYEILEPEYDDTEITINMDLDRGEQSVVMFAVTAMISGEESIYAHSDNIFIGEPYSLPYENHFNDSGEDYVLGATADEGVLWRILDDFSDPQSQDGDDRYICMVGNQTEQYGELSTGKIDFSNAANPFVSFYTYVYDEDENEVSVRAVDCATGEETTVGTFVLTDLENIGWTRIICPLKEFAGKIARVVIGAHIVSHGYMPFDNMVIDDLSAVDLSVDRVNHSNYAAAGETYDVTAKISNIGADRVDSYIVRLISDGRVIDTVKGTPLESFGSTEVTLHGQFSAVSPEMPTFTVEVVAEGDANTENNVSLPFNITFLAPCHPVVSDLHGEESGSAVTLTWSAPDLSTAAPEESFEDFESYPAFTTELNGFTMVDVDCGNIAGFSNFEMPVKGTQQAFWTMTSHEPYNFLYTQGRSSLFAMATVDANRRPIANDDWLISPELYGGRQTIGFSACAQSINYGYETFEVYATSSSKPNINNFEKVMIETSVGEEWKQFYVTLPAGTKYFAIRCTSNDRLLFTLDDISFIAKGEPRALELKGYNVYRNGVQLNSEPVTATTYATTRDLAGDDYFVTAVYDKGESTASNVVHLGEVGIGEIEADATATEEYYDLRGMKVAPSALTPGLYIVRRGNTATKVMIR
ncbi:MAG: choice-of-anchor J domain-containing protein [Muribaculaceae bacterium]|nr:choice-of-anchor J domain-containing protein [Muribaculaceae bacterium]